MATADWKWSFPSCSLWWVIFSAWPQPQQVSAREHRGRQRQLGFSGSPMVQGLKNENTWKHFLRRWRRGEAIRRTERSKWGVRNRESKKFKPLEHLPASWDSQCPCLLGNSAGWEARKRYRTAWGGLNRKKTHRLRKRSALLFPGHRHQQTFLPPAWKMRRSCLFLAPWI